MFVGRTSGNVSVIIRIVDGLCRIDAVEVVGGGIGTFTGAVCYVFSV